MSLLDTDLSKLTMQCCVLKFFPDVSVTYSFTNWTPDKKLSRAAFKWLQAQVEKLENIRICPYLNSQYLRFLSTFHLKPATQLKLSFTAINDTGSDKDLGDFCIDTEGLWLDTILEAYFKSVEKAWSYEGQVEKAYQKGSKLLEGGCIFLEFGTRRRRDYYTQDLVLQGLRRAADEGKTSGWSGKLLGTSNVHFAHKHKLVPIGTVAHEWFMGIAAITNDYVHTNKIALEYWTATFGEGVLGIALTDTFGTPAFLKAFKKQIPNITTAIEVTQLLASTEPPIYAGLEGANRPRKTFAEVFTGVRQDSGDPLDFVKMMREFYDQEGIKDKKAIRLVSSAKGRHAVKISDNIGKNNGDKATVEEVKRRLGYTEKEWAGGDEKTRWGTAKEPAKS
ncbi:Nicotinate/Quinolinate PRTase C-terminal domain-like protein [Macroventuria anomochaeta]|uniref:Nicotinate/Quinolinate PRTase C-terminal domain-like protein n=1 Tax=Macroventuria anomochaeta TaxID=301207 RepID=A0ACB6RJL8_9PLEO|nr:Nicotinate/Quinolinate PRTase C-terminal domain-like protein [Macroventuria anomochaeta]KAF2621159.1 Nicotinate/Quinolinate PRTase C-terminal domain-like protein [Macroventuria anomochaeta]